MKILIASDHGGYYLKEELKSYLAQKGHQIEDFGNSKYDPQDDYPDFIIPLAQRLAQTKQAFGIILGRSGNGEAIAANKVKGIYACLCLNEKMAKRARQHNNANIISLGAEYLSPTLAKKTVDAFLKTPFSSAQRHRRRVKAIKAHESAHFK